MSKMKPWQREELMWSPRPAPSVPGVSRTPSRGSPRRDPRARGPATSGSWRPPARRAGPHPGSIARRCDAAKSKSSGRRFRAPPRSARACRAGGWRRGARPPPHGGGEAARVVARGDGPASLAVCQRSAVTRTCSIGRPSTSATTWAEHRPVPLALRHRGDLHRHRADGIEGDGGGRLRAVLGPGLGAFLAVSTVVM